MVKQLVQGLAGKWLASILKSCWNPGSCSWPLVCFKFLEYSMNLIKDLIIHLIYPHSKDWSTAMTWRDPAFQEEENRGVLFCRMLSFLQSLFIEKFFIPYSKPVYSLDFCLRCHCPKKWVTCCSLFGHGILCSATFYESYPRCSVVFLLTCFPPTSTSRRRQRAGHCCLPIAIK